MDKIGVVTFFNNYNYGSVLQCYALQQILKRNNIQPVVLNQVEGGVKWKIKKSYRILNLIISTFKYHDRLKDAYKYLFESKRSCNYLSNETIESFNRFVNEKINSMDVSFDELKNSNDFIGYISGSDQVWNTSSYFLNPFMFLQFATNKKKYSYAASFGSDNYPEWYENKLKKYLKQYAHISVREEKAIAILKKFGIKSDLHIDPTLLLTDSEWRSISQPINEEQYLLLYFLNEPSPLAICHINNLIQKNKGKIKKIIALPYEFSSFKDLIMDVQYLNVSPEQFLSAVDNAYCVCTDSFHGAVFSTIFKKNFYSYYRSYAHNSTQNNRIETLLSKFNLVSQLVQSKENFNLANFKETEKIISNGRRDSFKYLTSIIGEMKNGK